MSEFAYRRFLRAPAYGLWTGVLDVPQAEAAMRLAVERGIRMAWREGAGECGITQDEFTFEELLKRDNFTMNQLGYVQGFIDFISQNSREKGGKRGVIYARIELWVNRYREAVSLAAATACANKKKIFLLGATQKHCRSCAGLHGRIYRYRTWKINGAIPPSSSFECGGHKCLCGLFDTDGRITPGRFPTRLLT